MIYNISVVFSNSVLTTTVEAEDEESAEELGIETIAEEHSLNLTSGGFRYQVEVEQADDDTNEEEE